MVKTTIQNLEITVVLSPNYSMSWRLNVILVSAIAFWSGMIGVGFCLLGAWPVLPFVGLEIIGLILGLWYTQRKLNCKEVISISSEQVVFEQGVFFPVHRMIWQRESIRGMVTRNGHPLQAPEIELFDSAGRNCRIGAFLNKADSDLLIVFLRNQGIALRTGNQISQVCF